MWTATCLNCHCQYCYLLTFGDKNQDQEEEEDLPLPGPIMTKCKQKKLGLLHAYRVAVVGCSAGAGDFARSSMGKIVILGERFHPAMCTAMVASSSSTDG
jgi:hypothetical protein